MKKTFILLPLFAFAVLISLSIGTAGGEGNNGEALFKQHCSSCHPDGGNIVNPQKTCSKEGPGGKWCKNGFGHNKQDEESRARHDAV